MKFPVDAKVALGDSGEDFPVDAKVHSSGFARDIGWDFLKASNGKIFGGRGKGNQMTALAEYVHLTSLGTYSLDILFGVALKGAFSVR